MSLKMKYILASIVLIMATLLLTSCGPPPACSTDFLVWSINNANSNGPSTDTINLDPGCVYELDVVDNTIEGNNGLPSITTSIIINGNGATVRRGTIAQKSAIRLFHVSQGGELVLNDITLLDGLAMEPVNTTLLIPNSGGAILNNGTLFVNNSVLNANRARRKGGGIYNLGTMEINGSSIVNNEANIGNEPNETGGGILNTGTATINDSTIAYNIASQSAGGIGNSGSLTITNSTISGNSTTLSGIVSGAAMINSGFASISYTTISDNIGITSGAVFSVLDTIEIHNTIITKNIPSNCSYPATSMILGPNMSHDSSCMGFITDDANLGPLAFNGGPTQTHSIPANSPARDLAFGLHPATDQRGVPRPHGSDADIGSFEFDGGGQPTVNSSIITGMVFDDLNADGVLDPGEPGIDGVELVLENGACLAPGSAVSELTASGGTYQFEILPPTAGAYCLSIDPLIPPNDTLLIPGGFTIPVGGKYEITLTEGEDLSDMDFGWDYQFSGTDIQPNPVITNVALSTSSPTAGDFVQVDVTIENQGAYPADNYELVLIPQYGVGPPNPAGYEALPSLMPNVPHTEVFSPGVLYPTAGTYTLRVLVTDDWYALGDPDSTGTNGDFQDFTITVLPALSFCNPFADMKLEVVMLKIREDTMSLPLYFKSTDVFPGGEDGNPPGPEVFHAVLGEVPSNSCDPQGFENREYCTFTLTPEMPGNAYNLYLYKHDCDDPVYTILNVQLPGSTPAETTCSEDLGERACEAAGGTFYRPTDKTTLCVCP